MPETFKAALARGTETLRGIGLETAALDARVLLCAAAGVSREYLIAHGDELLGAQAQEAFDKYLHRRQGSEPVARIVGEKEFWSLPFRVGPATLVPRPDSECIVEAALEAIPDRAAPLRVLDLGTGSGCLLLALLSELPNATGVGVDIADEAVTTARENAAALGLQARAQFLVGNWLEGLAGPFDLVIANPPYIPTAEIESLDQEVRGYDPIRALDGGPDGLDAYRAFVFDLPKLMAPDAVLVLETAPHILDPLAQLLKDVAGFSSPENIHDLALRKRGLRLRKAC